MKYPNEEAYEVILQLDDYDDIFSDFDMRPYSKRALSIDFLDEIKRATGDKSIGAVELLLHTPHAQRNEAHELVIKERLAAHFKRHFDLAKKDKFHVLRRGWGMVFVGIAFMIAATFVAHEGADESLLLSFLLIFLEPAAWFLLWEGMDLVIFHSKTITPELDFYRKMSHEKSIVHFKSVN